MDKILRTCVFITVTIIYYVHMYLGNSVLQSYVAMYICASIFCLNNIWSYEHTYISPYVYEYICTLTTACSCMASYICTKVSTSCTCILTLQDACIQYNHMHVRTGICMLCVSSIYSYDVKL